MFGLGLKDRWLWAWPVETELGLKSEKALVTVLSLCNPNPAHDPTWKNHQKGNPTPFITTNISCRPMFQLLALPKLIPFPPFGNGTIEHDGVISFNHNLFAVVLSWWCHQRCQNGMFHRKSGSHFHGPDTSSSSLAQNHPPWMRTPGRLPPTLASLIYLILDRSSNRSHVRQAAPDCSAGGLRRRHLGTFPTLHSPSYCPC